MRRLIAIAIVALVFGALSGVAAYQKMHKPPAANAGAASRAAARKSACGVGSSWSIL
jgi:hypothetical protein